MTDHIPNAIDRAVIAARWMAVNVLTAARERETRAEGELDSARREAAARLDELAALNEHLGLNHDEIDYIDGDMLLQALGRRDTLANNGLTDDHDSTPATVDLSPIEEAVRALVRTLDEHGHHISQAEGEDGLADALVEALTEHAPKIAREVSPVAEQITAAEELNALPAEAGDRICAHGLPIDGPCAGAAPEQIAAVVCHG